MRLFWLLASLSLLVACGGGSNSPSQDAGSGSVANGAGSDAAGGSGGNGSGGNGAGGNSQRQYDATVRYTSFGVPHIQADDWGSLGFGNGYAFAEDNTCVYMRDIITIRGERAQYFGRNGSYTIHSNGAVAGNVDSDFFWRHVATDQVIADYMAPQDAQIREVIRGYAAGFSRYVRELKAGGHAGRHLDCRNEPWLFEINEIDMFRRIYRLAILASASAFVEGVATAQPPLPNQPDNSGGGTAAEQIAAAITGLQEGNFPFAGELPIGSNMYALGPDATDTGQPFVFVNPHFPWQGTERLWMSHLTIPGVMNIMGTALHGSPAVLIGFNDAVAWSHTVSAARRFTFYELTLAPGSTTSYIHDGQTVPMIANEITIEVLGEDDETRTLYRSQYGPMLTFAGVLNWTANQAYSIRDANAENIDMMKHFFGWNTANSFDAFKQIQRDTVAVPWVNTVASGPGGDAWYSDLTNIPNVPDSMLTQCSSSPIAQAVRAVAPGVHTLDGSMSACNWVVDPDAPRPGVFAASDLPELSRNDWVHNCNDSYWLSNPAEPLTGFASIVGDENSERSLRTRLCMLQVQRRLAGSDGHPGDKFTFPLLQEIVLSSHIYSAELLRDAVVSQACAGPTQVAGQDDDGNPMNVDIGPACSVLQAWDMTTTVSSQGGHVWREFYQRARGINGLYQNPYSDADPVNTPNTLNPATVTQVREMLGRAVTALAAVNIALDATLGDIQFDLQRDGSTQIPIFGDSGSVGAFTIAQGASLETDGYGPVTYGNSYVQTVTWDSNNEVISEGFVTYSQSTDPTSPHFDDMTQRYSQQQWIRWPFHEDEILADLQRSFRITENRTD